MTVGRQLFTRCMKSRHERWRERVEGGGEECTNGKARCVSDMEEIKWYKGRRIADILRWTEGQR